MFDLRVYRPRFGRRLDERRSCRKTWCGATCINCSKSFRISTQKHHAPRFKTIKHTSVNENIIKLCDYDLARKESVLVSPANARTNNVITLWYRPPELLFGATINASVDIWSIGCILGELLLGKVLFKGSTHWLGQRGVDKARTNSSQMAKIFMITGSPLT